MIPPADPPMTPSGRSTPDPVPFSRVAAVDGVAGVFGRRWWLVLLPLLLLAGVAMAVVEARGDRYRAVATVRVDAPADDVRADALLLLASPSFLTQVAAAADIDIDRDGLRTFADRFDVTQDGGSLVRLAYVGDGAGEAQAAAGAAAEGILRSRRAAVAERVSAAVDAAEDQVELLEAQVAAATDEVAAFDRRHPPRTPADPALPRAVAAEGAELGRELARRQDALAEARDALDGAEREGAAALARAETEQLEGGPLPPEHEGVPRVLLGILVALVGTAIGIGLALLAERRDHTVRTEIDVQEAVPGIPILAVLERS